MSLEIKFNNQSIRKNIEGLMQKSGGAMENRPLFYVSVYTRNQKGNL